MFIYTDSGRLTRPLYYIDKGNLSYGNKHTAKLLHDDKYQLGKYCELDLKKKHQDTKD